MDEQVPRHIGYIVDGNRRWAKDRGLSPYKGHLQGYKVLKQIAQRNLDLGVEYMSAYIWSTENWKRSEEETTRLMRLMVKALTSDIPEFMEKNIRLRILGSLEKLDSKVLSAIENAQLKTKNNSGGTLALCFNYGGQQEIVDAVKKIVHSGVNVENINTEMISSNIYEPDIPPLDLIIRTGGEQRLSNFMLWRSAYSELMFLDKYWPDMDASDVDMIIDEYSHRQRRFGA